MIIGIDGSRAFVRQRTGTENYSYELLKALAKVDNKNLYLVYIRPETKDQRPRTIENLPENFRFVEIPLSRFWTQVGLAFRTWIDKLDLLFVPAHTLPVLRRPGLPTIVTIHDLGYEYLPSYHQFPHKIYLNWSTEYAVKSATRIIAVSKTTRKDLITKLHCDVQKISLIYEGVEAERFRKRYTSDEINVVFKRYKIKKPYFLFVGTIQPRKNLVRLIEAFAKASLQLPASSLQSLYLEQSRRAASSFQLLVVGKPGWMYEEIYEAPKKFGVEDRVKFLGHVDDSDLPIFYQNALCLVLPSLYEGFGLPVLEAMASGCPVVASNVSSLLEIVGEVGILVDPHNTDSIADGIIKAIQFYQENQKSKENIYNNLIEKGLQRVKEFTWEKAARRTLEVFEIVGRK